jgi:hypothetical protein
VRLLISTPLFLTINPFLFPFWPCCLLQEGNLHKRKRTGADEAEINRLDIKISDKGQEEQEKEEIGEYYKWNGLPGDASLPSMEEQEHVKMKGRRVTKTQNGE